jgi:phenylacetic acid degradation operon negative regulatory protein
MQPKTEELLNFLLWSADKLMRPTFRNLTDSYESWAYRNGLLPQATKLEKQQLLERDPKSSTERLYRLTEQGRLHALGGRDPQAQWTRYWDGRWRLVLFDVPEGQNTRRERLRRYLRSRAFGCLQGSVWIRPDSVHGEREILAGGQVNVETLLLLEARPAAGESDAEIVAGAWDFAEINRRYVRHKDARAAGALRRWAAHEREAWLAAVQSDPLLPERLLPAKYLGRRAWERRKAVLGRSGECLRRFAP